MLIFFKGCGKTTVAELLAAAMAEVGYRTNPVPFLTNAGDILKAKDPVGEFEQLVESASGGTVFIDEAYLLKPAPRGSTANASNGVLDYLLKVAETKRETTTFILAGYKEDLLALLAYNDGFPSRFPKEFTFFFEDYTELQLRRIFIDMVSSRGYKLRSKKQCGAPLAKIVSRRLARGSGKKGFGNARTVRNFVDLAVNKHKDRIGSKILHMQKVSDAEHSTLELGDVIGDRPNLAQSPLLKELDAMIGLKSVKEAVHGLMELQLQNYDRELRGEKREEISLHRVFYGNPGNFAVFYFFYFFEHSV